MGSLQQFPVECQIRLQIALRVCWGLLQVWVLQNLAANVQALQDDTEQDEGREAARLLAAREYWDLLLGPEISTQL